MYEDAADIFIRARDALIESVDKDVDIDSSVQEYMLAKANLVAHGFDYEPTWREMLCDNLIKNEKREGFVPSPTYKKRMREERRERHKGHLPRTNHFAGRIMRNDPSLSHGIPVSAIADPTRHHSRADEHILSGVHDPLEKRSMTSGRQRKIEFLARRFLPDEEGNSRAKDVKRAERLIEDWMKGTGNPHVTENTEGTYSYPLLGPLGDSVDQSILSHEDDIYERDFRRWSRDNAAGQDNREIRLQHFDDRAKAWMDRSGPEFDESGELSEDDKTILAYLSESPEAEAIRERVGSSSITKHPSYLNQLSFMLGLQWLSPEERSKVMDHLSEHGSDSKEQHVKFDDGTRLPMGRLKRNMRMASENALSHVRRGPKAGPHNVAPVWSQNYEIGPGVDDRALYSVLEHAYLVDDKVTFDRIEAEKAEMAEKDKHCMDKFGRKYYECTVEQQRQTDREVEGHGKLMDKAIVNLHEAFGIKTDDGDYVERFMHLPDISPSQLAGIEGDMVDEMETLTASKKKGNVVNRDNLLHVLGFDSKGNEIPTGEHGYPSHSGPLIDNAHLKELLRKEKEFKLLPSRRREIQDVLSLFGTNVPFKDLETVPLEVQEAISILGDKHFAGDFASMYHEGGHAIDQHILTEKLHDHHSERDDSIISSVNRDKEDIIPNPINMGLFGHLMRPSAEAALGPHAMQHHSNFLGTAMLNHALSSVTFPSVARLLHGMKQSEVGSKYGKKQSIDQLNNLLIDTVKEGRKKNIPYGKELMMRAKDVTDYDREMGREVGDIFAGGGSVRRLDANNWVHTSGEQRRNKIEHMRLASLLGGLHTRFPTSNSGIDFNEDNIRQLEQAFSTTDETGGRKKAARQIDQMNLKHQYELKSIVDAARHLATLLPPEALDPDNPAFDANIRRLFHDANKSLHVLPSEYWEGVGVRPMTADYMISQQMQKAEPIYSRLRERLTQGGGIPVTSRSDPSELAEQLGFPLDDAHIQHVRSYIESIPDGRIQFIQSNHNLIKEHGDLMGLDSGAYDDHLDEHIKQQYGYGVGSADSPLVAEQRNLKTMRSRMEKDVREWDLMSGKRLLEVRARLEELEPLIEQESRIRSFDALHSRALRYLEDNNVDRATSTISRLAERMGVDVDTSNPRQALDSISDMISEQRGSLGYGRQLHGHSKAIQSVFNKDRREQHEAFGVRRVQAPLETEKTDEGVVTTTPFARMGEKERYGKGIMGDTTRGQAREGKSATHRHNQTLHNLRDLVVYDPESDTGANEDSTFATERLEFGAQPITNFDSDGANAMHYFTSASAMRQHGYRVRPTHGFEFNDGSPQIGTQSFEQALVSVPNDMISAALGPDVAQRYLFNGMNTDVYGMTEFEPPANRGDAMGVPLSQTPMIGKSIQDAGLYATFMLNPDLIVKADAAPEWVPPIRPMHRIFRMRDLEELRGFTGSWVVSKWYDGDRIVLTKKKGRVKAFDEDGGQRAIPDWAKKGVKNLGEKDCTLDGILGKDTLHIMDIMHYDGTDIMDMNVRERFKVLRGQYDSHEQVIIVGPHDTRFTDEEGLKDAVETLQAEHRTLLLRDGKSTYMRGERRHPKWVVLRPNRDINLIVLDRRGNGPYTYRLGAGPLIDGEGLGDRAVDHDGNVYLDAGTVSSPKPFEEGDIVKVRFSGIKRQRKGGRDIFTISPSKLVGEGQGESSVSMETLSILAKAYSPVHLPHGIDIKDDTLLVTLPNESIVTYTLEKSSLGHWVHSPTTPLSDMGMDTYSIELSESLKPFWGEVASMMLKGKIERQKDAESEVAPTEEQQEHRRKVIEEESAGILKPEDKNILLKPKMKKALEVLERALDVLEKEQMFNTTGGKGLGIDMGSGIQSPRGPTSLTSEMSLPDWDMKERPEEDPEDEYPKAKALRNRKKRSQSSDSKDEINPKQE